MSDYWRDMPVGPRADGTEPTTQAWPYNYGGWMIQQCREDGRWAYWWPDHYDQFGPWPRGYKNTAAECREYISRFMDEGQQG